MSTTTLICIVSVLVVLGIVALAVLIAEFTSRRGSLAERIDAFFERAQGGQQPSYERFCHHCRHGNVSYARYCAKCGRSLELSSSLPLPPVEDGFRRSVRDAATRSPGLGVLGTGPYRKMPEGIEIPKAFQDKLGGRPGLTSETDLGRPLDDPSDKQLNDLDIVKELLESEES